MPVRKPKSMEKKNLHQNHGLEVGIICENLNHATSTIKNVY